ncbi:hypothetical protein QYS46_01505 [Klebsiella michiganensis]|nr:hypothetical protein [Klebsiella michiganensis]
MRKAGEASPARDERLANLEQRDPRSGDARGLFVYHLFRKQMMGKQEHGDIEMIVCINRLKQFGIFSDFNGTKIQKFVPVQPGLWLEWNRQVNVIESILLL